MKISRMLAISAACTLIPLSGAYASTHKCVGMDGEGAQINVLYDEDTNTINVNGTVLKITAGTQGKNGVASEDYKMEDGEDVYVTLVVEGDNKNDFVLRQYAAKDDKVIATVPLACK
jgi:hypothetical protein